MAAVAPTAVQATDLLKNMSLDSQSKTLEIPEPTKKVNTTENGNDQNQPLNRSVTPLIPDYMDPTVAYYPNSYASTAYYYGGYDGTTNDWDDYSRYVNPDGVDMTHGVYGDMYQGYGYSPYGPYSPAGSPVPTVGHDGQVYGAQHYQYPSPYFQPTSGPYSLTTNISKGVNTPSVAIDKTPLNADNGKTNGQQPLSVDTSNRILNTGLAPIRPAVYQNPNSNGSYNRSHNGIQDPRYGFDGAHSPLPWLNSSLYSNRQPRNNMDTAPFSNANGFASKNQNIRPHSHLVSPRPMSAINAASGYMNSMYPNKLYGRYRGSGFGFGSNSYGSQNNGNNWLTIDNKYRPRGRNNGLFGYNNENSDGLNELNRGPRAQITKNQTVPTQVTLTAKGQNGNLSNAVDVEKDTVSAALVREQYNQKEFPDTYTDAKFFVIKSYSEDDVHKSIKYNVWSSTQNGNKKLDAAYQEAQQKSPPCPVFLSFSVNTSGQFVGVAEMAGPVDFNKSLEHWQQDKWIGCFPVKWHIVKDVPNSLLKHITLEYNENKPVTNSRDTQEVKLEQGLQLIKIFKEYSSKQCVLDDFEFYEDRQKRIQEKKAKQQQFQKPTTVETKLTENTSVVGNNVENGC